MTHAEIYSFRAPLAQVMRHTVMDDYMTAAAIFHFIREDFAEFVGISAPEVNARAVLKEAYKSIGSGDVAILAQYRPGAPSVTIRDYVRLGEYQANNWFRHPTLAGQTRTVHILDYIIVDGQGGWVSVMDEAGISICSSCGHRLLLSTSLPQEHWGHCEWSYVEGIHKEGCPLGALAGETAKAKLDAITA